MGLFGGKSKTPKVEPPAPMPDDQNLNKARRKRISREQKSGGFRSTLLSTGGRETLG